MFSRTIRTYSLLSILALGLPAIPFAPGVKASGPITALGRDCGGTSSPGIAGEAGIEPMIFGAALEATTASRTWSSDTHFLDGDFRQTEVVPGSGRVTLERRWKSNVQANSERVAAIQDAPSLAVDAVGTLVAAWQDFRRGNGDIYVGRSVDGGRTWAAGGRANRDTGSAEQQEPSSAAGGANAFFLAWTDYRRGNADIFFAASADAGRTWSANVKVNNDGGSSQQSAPTLARAANGYLYLAWEDYRHGNADIYMARSTDGGLTWSPNVQVNDKPLSSRQVSPSLDVGASGQPYLAWEDYRNDNADIYAARSTDSGLTWSANTRVNTGAEGPQTEPSLGVDDDEKLYVAWLSNGRVFAARSSDGSASWNRQTPLSGAGSSASRPSLKAGSNGAVFCVWCAMQNDVDTIFVARSTNSGEGWHAPVQANDGTPANRSKPDLAMDSQGHVYSVWKDDRGGEPDIWTAAWPDNQRFFTGGAYVAAPHDAGRRVSWEALRWWKTNAPGASITLAVRVGTTPIPDRSWSRWMTLAGSPADLRNLPESRYLQWRATITSSTGRETPALDAVRLAWQ